MAVAREQWLAENKVETTTDTNYIRDTKVHDALVAEKPWRRDPLYFQAVHISAIALIKILAHAKTGKGKAGVISQDKNTWVEVMGVTQGHVRERTFVITDSFALPVAANEVECAMTDEAAAYLVDTVEACGGPLKRLDSGVIGWYHSHPGYSCFLSGTDVPTQSNCQQFMDPYIALVVDPVKSLSTGQVEIKAFRTYPEGYTPPEGTSTSNAALLDADVPTSKIQEYGAHYNRYYEVPITVYRSTTDAKVLNQLWDRYWMQTLAASPLSTNRHFLDGRLREFAAKMGRLEDVRPTAAESATGTGDPLAAAVGRAAAVASHESLQGLLALLIKHRLFAVQHSGRGDECAGGAHGTTAAKPASAAA